MPTVNPRVQVTLSPGLDAIVRRMAALQRISKGAVIRELLEAAEPALTRAVALMDAAQRAAADVKVGLRGRLDRAQDQAEDAAAVMLSRMERMTGDLVGQAETVQGRRPRRAAEPHSPASGGVRNPPASNRGVKSGPGTRKPRPLTSARKGGKAVKS